MIYFTQVYDMKLELEEKDEVYKRYPEDTTSIGSNSSHDEKDMNSWRIHVSGIDELRDNTYANVKSFVFLIEVQRLDPNSNNPLLMDDEKTNWIIA
ncbi:unnamed protein product, partial [Rotaria magnacalcarata]